MSPLTIEEPLDQAPSWDTTTASGPSLLKMKYIRHRTLGFILFESSVRHDDLASRFGDRDEVLSAGFVFSPAADFRCIGQSDTLHIAAGPSDGTDLRRRMSAF